jgi:hypothetical protein
MKSQEMTTESLSFTMFPDISVLGDLLLDMLLHDVVQEMYLVYL